MRQKVGALLLAAFVMLALGVPQTFGGASQFTILLSMKGPGSGNPFWAAVERGARETAKSLGVNLVVLAPPAETDVQAQIAQIEDQIAKRVSALVVAPTDVSALNATFDKARARKIPVLFVDTDGTWPHKMTFIGTDNRAGGALGGKFLCDRLQGKGEAAIITGVMTTQSIRARVEGARGAMKACGLQVVAELPANSDRALGQQVMEDILTRRPNVKAVFAANDLMALGAAEAMKARGRMGQVLIVGFDAIPEAAQAVLKGDLAASVAQSPYNMGKFGVENALKVLRGQTIAKRIDTGTILVTKANAQQYAK
ncbi:MAG TPA: sugar ABC transporter substrate-binding protein [bacterium]|jgi:ribose transport system substrate-binding protein|nr:sugar ABC transporter substrate-binding protein [bacterium]